jgi:Ca2+-binding RTX toxin-like protein
VDSAGLTYSVTLSDGSALPTWLSFNTAMRTFSGVPQDGDAGTLSLLVTATDPSGLSASDTFDLVVSDNPGRLIAGTAKADVINASFNKGLGSTSGEDTVNAGNGNDQVYGLDGGDQVYGGSGDDKLYGQQGRDRLYGEDGSDLLDGGLGEDIVSGGLGNDTMIGGAASDTFVFLLSGKSKKSETDLIMDFSTDDRIDVDASITVTVVGTGTDATGDGVADTVLKLGTSNIVVLSKFTAWSSDLLI